VTDLSDDHRIEIKIPLPGHMLSEARFRIHMHPSGLIRTYPARQVNSIYYDSYDLKALRLNESGVSDRVKIRVRWYGNLHQMKEPVLEIKSKTVLSGQKVRISMTTDFDLFSRKWSLLTDDVHRTLPTTMLGIKNLASHPVLINSYQRDYFATQDGNLRVTLDHDIRSFDQLLAAKPNLHRPTVAPDIVVIELKAPVEEEAFLRE
ncbi:uncharacterized protein METZ01_LOCUS461480, partial [marine metagenome]